VPCRKNFLSSPLELSLCLSSHRQSSVNTAFTLVNGLILSILHGNHCGSPNTSIPLLELQVVRGDHNVPSKDRKRTVFIVLLVLSEELVVKIRLLKFRRIW